MSKKLTLAEHMARIRPLAHEAKLKSGFYQKNLPNLQRGANEYRRRQKIKKLSTGDVDTING